MDDLFEFTNHNSATHAKTELRQTEEGYILDVLLPGFEKDEIGVRTEGNDLIVECKTDRKLPKFLNSKVKKTFQVEDLDSESIAAKLECGILSITFSTAKKRNAKSISVA